MNLLASFIATFGVSPDPEPASSTSLATAGTRKDVHLALHNAEIPKLSYSFGVDNNPVICDFFQQYKATQHEYAIRKILAWINAGMPSGTQGNNMLTSLRHIIEAHDREDKEGAAKRKMIYRIIMQHVEKGSPIDDTWITQEVVAEPSGLISVEVVKNTYESAAFLENVTKRKILVSNGDVIYVVHLENMPYESYAENDIHRINAYLWLKQELKTLLQKHPAKYIVATSPFAKDFFATEEIYPLHADYQEKTRVYRNLMASADLDAQEEQKVRTLLLSEENETQKNIYEQQLKHYDHRKMLIKKNSSMALGVKKIDAFLSS